MRSRRLCENRSFWAYPPPVSPDSPFGCVPGSSDLPGCAEVLRRELLGICGVDPYLLSTVRLFPCLDHLTSDSPPRASASRTGRFLPVFVADLGCVEGVEVGLGLFAAEGIAKHSILGEYTGVPWRSWGSQISLVFFPRVPPMPHRGAQCSLSRGTNYPEALLWGQDGGFAEGQHETHFSKWISVLLSKLFPSRGI